eukprot:1887466-Prymnesium_polylepis.4
MLTSPSSLGATMSGIGRSRCTVAARLSRRTTSDSCAGSAGRGRRACCCAQSRVSRSRETTAHAASTSAPTTARQRAH